MGTKIGWLMKKGGRWSRWKRRFCVLHTRYFVWHEEERHNIATLLFDPEDSEAIGRFPVSDMKLSSKVQSCA